MNSIVENGTLRRIAIPLLTSRGWELFLVEDGIPGVKYTPLEMRIVSGIENVKQFLIDLWDITVDVKDTKYQKSAPRYVITASNGERFFVQKYYSVYKSFYPYKSGLPGGRLKKNLKSSRRSLLRDIDDTIPDIDKTMYYKWLNSTKVREVGGFKIYVKNVPFIIYECKDISFVNDIVGDLKSVREVRDKLPKDYTKRIIDSLYPSGKRYKWLWQLVNVDTVRDVANIITPYGKRGILYSDVYALLKKPKYYNLASPLVLSHEIPKYTYGFDMLSRVYYGLSINMGRLGKVTQQKTVWIPENNSDYKIIQDFIKEILHLENKDTIIEEFFNNLEKYVDCYKH